MSLADEHPPRHGHAELSDTRLHYVEAGEGPLVLLLHGFPEFWFAWRAQIDALAAAGFRVVAPDLRGYNLSARPRGVAAYALPRLARDVRDLIEERGERRACVAGHDWGATVAWATAAWHPEVVRRLAILNVPHPHRLMAGLRTWGQLQRSWYIFFFQLPWLPERLLAAGGHRSLRASVEGGAPAGAVSPPELESYLQAWQQPGALTAMLAYYRAAARGFGARLPPVTAPTLVIWGRRDHYLGAELAVPDRRDVPNLQRVEWLPDASHWVMRDAPQAVVDLLDGFFAEAAALEDPTSPHPPGSDG